MQYDCVLGDDFATEASAVAAQLKARGWFENLRLPVTEHLPRRGLCLPSRPALTDQHVVEVATALKSVLATTLSLSAAPSH